MSLTRSAAGMMMLLVMVVAVFIQAARPADKTEDRPNLLLITIDTLRADRVGAAGPEGRLTPNLDALSKTGVVFLRAFAHTPTTLPSHATILTGVTPLFHGVHDNLNFMIRKNLTTLSEHLASEGYRTGAFVGAYPLDSRFGLSQGFDVYDDDYRRRHDEHFSATERKAEEVIAKALSWIKAAESPWFAWVHCYDPHTPYEPPEPFKSRFTDPYDGEVAYTDAALGRLLDYLSESGQDEGTVVLVTGDHGESLGEHGEPTHSVFAYNSTLWIPLIIKGPGINHAEVNDYVSHVDIFPTLCEILDIRPLDVLQGTTLVPLWEKGTQARGPIYIESLYPYYSRGWAPIRGYIFNEGKFLDSPIPEFYELDKDFRELKNALTPLRLRDGRMELDRMQKDLSHPDAGQSRGRFDREALEKLQSLGYMSGARSAPGSRFTKDDDAKVMMPFLENTEEAWRLFQSGDRDGAVRKLEDIRKIAPKLDMVYRRLAAVHTASGRHDLALEILVEGLENVNESYEIYVEYIKTLNRAGRYQNVIREMARSPFEQAAFDPEIWYNLGLAHFRLGDAEKAVGPLEEGMNLVARYPQLVDLLAEVEYTLALKLRQAHRMARAEELYKEAISLDPEFVHPLIGLGQIYRRSRRLDDAVSLWETALEKEPDNSGAMYNLGVGLLEKGEPARALVHLERYKTLYASMLSPDLQKHLDDLIALCRR